MICEKCGIENKDDAVFCQNCGTNLTGTFKCPNCGGTVSNIIHYCSHCGYRFIKNKNKPHKPIGTSWIPLTTNIIIILFCFFLTILLFGNIGSRPYGSFPFSRNLGIDIIDFFDASIKGLGFFNSADFAQMAYNSGPIFINSNHVNFLLAYMVDDAIYAFFVQQITIYLSTFLLTILLVLPLVLLGRSITDLINNQYSNRYKKYFFAMLMISLVMCLCLRIIDYNIGGSLFGYLFFCILGLIYAYVIEYLKKERQFNSRLFTLKIISIGMLFIIIFLFLTPIINFAGISNAHIGNLLSMCNQLKLNINHDIYLYTPLNEFPYQASLNLKGNFGYYVLPIAHLISFFLLLSFFGKEVLAVINNQSKTHSSLILWVAFGIQVIMFAFIIMFMVTLEQGLIIQFSIGFIFLLFFTLTLAIYQTSANRYLQKDM